MTHTELLRVVVLGLGTRTRVRLESRFSVTRTRTRTRELVTRTWTRTWRFGTRTWTRTRHFGTRLQAAWRRAGVADCYLPLSNGILFIPKVTTINPRTADRFFTRTAGGIVASPLTSVSNVIRIWFWCLSLYFLGQGFQKCWCRLCPMHRSAGNQDGGKEIGSEWKTRRACQKSVDKFGIWTESGLLYRPWVDRCQYHWNELHIRWKFKMETGKPEVLLT